MTKLLNSALWACLSLSVLVFSCKTIDTQFAPGTPTNVYFQRGQQASDLYDYQASMKIYNELLAQPDIDLSTRVQAQYEVAFLYHKLGENATAIAHFKKILAIYDDPTRTIELPIWVRILSEKVMKELEQKPKPVGL